MASKCPDVLFKIAGMLGKSRDREIDMALSSLEELPNVEFTGYLSREKVPLFLSKAVLLLNTSHFEGFSNTFLEAFSVGTPVIAPINADPDNIIAKNGLGVSVKNNSEFSCIIKKLLWNKKEFFEYSERCREYVYKNHDPIILAEYLVKVIKEIRGN